MRRHERLATSERVRSAFDDAPRGDSALVKTVTVTSYPTSANRFYGVQRLMVSGTEVEGGAPTLTAIGGVFYAYNRGSAIPPVNTVLLADEVGGRWTIEYDG